MYQVVISNLYYIPMTLFLWWLLSYVDSETWQSLTCNKEDLFATQQAELNTNKNLFYNHGIRLLIGYTLKAFWLRFLKPED